MAQYLKISSLKGGSCNTGLKKSIIFIGKRYGRLANKEGHSSKKYFKYGVKFIANKFGAFRKNAIFRMVKPKSIKNSNAKQWCYNKQVYGKAYGYIIKLLLRCQPKDKEYVTELLNNLYHDICKEPKIDSNLERLCSNALIYRQKEMLKLYNNNPKILNYDKEEAGKLLIKIAEFDKPLPNDFKGVL